MQTKGLLINGRFLAREQTGVHRVAYEHIRQIARHRQELTQLFGAPPLILAPRNVAPQALGGIPLVLDNRSALTGALWEQVELPVRAGGALLLNLCNLGPMMARHSAVMIHDAQTVSTPASYGLMFRAYYRMMQGVIGVKATRILTVSEFSRGEIDRYGIAPAAKIDVIHNGSDHGRAITPDTGMMAKLGLQPGRYVLGLASAQAHKNIRRLLAAFADNAMEPLKLVLFGSGGAAKMRAQGLNVPDHVVCPGRLSDAQLAGLMGQALCLAMPSLTEGFGLPPLEAMYWGCPTVVAPCGALPEVCGDAALYAAPDDTGQWRDAFRRLANEPQLRETLITAGHSRAAQLSWDSGGEQLMAVLRDLARRGV